MPKCFRYKEKYYDEEYDVEELHEFRCYLESKQCEARSRYDARCRNTVIMGLPYCHAHAKIIYQVHISNSDYVGRDKRGLFAYAPKAENEIVFRRGDVLFTFKGQVRSGAQMARRYGDLDQVIPPYAIKISADRYIDAACERSIASMINHAPVRDSNVVLGKKRRGGAFRTRPRQPIQDIEVIANKTIYHGDEILTNYGPGYRVDQSTHRTYDCPKTRTWDDGYRGL